MGDVTAANILVTDATVTIAGSDSANLRFLVPSVRAASCAGSAPALTLAFSGLDGTPPDGFTRKRVGELTLAPGDAARLNAADAACIRLAPSADGRYFLAYADSRVIEKARTGPEWPWPDSILVTVADRTGVAAAGTALQPTRATPRPGIVDAGLPLPGSPPTALGLPADCPYANFFLPFCRAAPYLPGELFELYPSGTSRPRDQARVMAIRGNLVLAVFLPDSGRLVPAGIPRADTALAFMERRAIPLLRRAFDLTAPTTTSDPSGQLLLSLERIDGPYVGFSRWYPDPSTSHGRWGVVTLGINGNSAFDAPVSNSTSALTIIAHEVMHTYQFRWRYEHAPWHTYLGSGWGVEGAASFFSFEMMREKEGLPFLGNTQLPEFWAENDPRQVLDVYTYFVRDWMAGYIQSASFLRDLTQRLVSAGLPFDDAIGEVLTGALEGWWGINEEGLLAGPGLAARMRRHLGPRWEPIDGLLDWTLSEAADDLTSNPRFQNLSVRQQSGAARPFQPDGVVRGTTISTIRASGNSGVMEISDAAGGSYTAGANVNGVASSAVEWALLRVR